jgi:TonB family protein
MIKASLILMLAFCFSKLLRRRSAAERHLLWIAALGSAALLPLLSLLLPEWRLEMASQLAAVFPDISQAGRIQGVGENAGTIIHAYGIQQTSGWETVLLAVWVIGLLVTLFLLFAGSATLKRLASRSLPLSDPAWQKTIAELKNALGFKRSVHLLQSSGGSMPLTWGVVRPRVLFPGASAEWSAERRFVVLAHELAHVQRSDWLVQILAELVCAIYWFHPLFWIARNQLHAESERACDDVVLSLGIEGQDYATQLLDIARGLRKFRPVCSLAMAQQFNLEKRLVAILSSTANRRPLTRNAVLIIVLAIACFVFPLAAMQPSLPDARLVVSPVRNGFDVQPRVAEYTTPPLYSDEGRSRNIEGSVIVEVRVGLDGRARDLRVVAGLGFGLDENALLAVRDWRFSPAKRDGKEVEAVTRVDVEFNVRNAELNEVIANDMATRVGPGVVPPGVIHRVEPQYPQAPTSRTRSGTVLLDAVIQENGVPKVVRVLQSLGWELDESAITALEQWRFSPAMKNGMPIKVRMNVEMTFGRRS